MGDWRYSSTIHNLGTRMWSASRPCRVNLGKTASDITVYSCNREKLKNFVLIALCYVGHCPLCRVHLTYLDSNVAIEWGSTVLLILLS
jgi:transcription initiation factor IIE alpha subunit